MKSDRELLELAAKAARLYTIDVSGDDDFWEGDDGTGADWGMRTSYGIWNPLTDDGDALRLAVKLRIELDYREDGTVNATWRKSDSIFAGNRNEAIGSLRNGPEETAATRRAIVRAAAAIGEKE